MRGAVPVFSGMVRKEFYTFRTKPFLLFPNFSVSFNIAYLLYQYGMMNITWVVSLVIACPSLNFLLRNSELQATEVIEYISFRIMNPDND